MLVNMAACVISILYFIILIIHNFSQHNSKFPEVGVLTPKHVAVILILMLRHLFVHLLV